MRGDHLGQSQQFDPHFIGLDTLFHHHAAIRAGRDHAGGAGRLYLGLFAIEGRQLQLFGTLVAADATATTATPVHVAMIGHFDEVFGNRSEQVTRLRVDAAASHDRARVVEGQTFAFLARGLELARRL